VSSLQKAGGIYSLVALSPSVGTYEGGRFRSNVPIRVIQPSTYTNDKRDGHTVDNSLGIKLEGERRKRKRQAGLPCVRMSYDVLEGASHGKLRVSVCWREVLYDDKPGGEWVNANLLF
jgi:hypothetical protein